MSIDLIRSFLEDGDRAARRAALLGLIDDPSPEVESIALRFLFDEAEIVRQAACELLRHRHPWIILHPFRVREVPAPVRRTKLGRSWQSLVDAMRTVTHFEDSPFDIDLLRRIPGLVPDMVDRLTEAGLHRRAEDLARDSNLYGRKSRYRSQLILIPTYDCNLDCTYCYARGVGHSPDEHMSLDDLRSVLDWAAEAGVDSLLLSGGEPTVYRHFAELLNYARDRKMVVNLTTNGNYSEEVSKLVHPESVVELVAHYDQARGRKSPSYHERFLTNISEAQAKGIPVLLRYTLTESSDASEWRSIIKIAGDNNLKAINYALAFRGSARENEHYTLFDDKPESAQTLVESQLRGFLADCEKEDVPYWLCKPIPLCSVGEEFLRELLLKDALRASCWVYLREYSQNLTVNPDATTFPCTAIFESGPKITKFPSLADAGAGFREFVDRLCRQPYRAWCKECIFWYRGFCHGTCLAEHYSASRDRSP